MKLKFKDQQFQIDATAAVCDVFEGQPYHDPTVYTVDPGRRLGIKNEELGIAEQGSLPGLGTLAQGRLDLEDGDGSPSKLQLNGPKCL